MRNPQKIRLCGFMAVVLLGFLFWGQVALAADSSGNWRHTYDLVMKWVNFAILVFLIVKFTRTPLINFLQSQKEKLKHQIKQVEEEKEVAAEKVQETLNLIDQSAIRFDQLKERIVAQGEKSQQEIIKAAKVQSQLMLDETKVRINYKIYQARKTLKEELVDAAIDLAMKKLPDVITDEDNQKLIERYIASADSK